MAAAHGGLDAHLVAEVGERSAARTPRPRARRRPPGSTPSRRGPRSAGSASTRSSARAPTSSGSRSSTVVPTPGVDASRTWPPDWRMKSRTIARPRPGAAAGLLGREERLEHASQRRRRVMPRAGVGDGDGDERAGDRRGRPRCPRGTGATRRVATGDRPAVGHRVARVDREVDDGLLELARVDPRDQRRRPAAGGR